MDVRDLLQLERALHRNGIVDPAPEEKRVIPRREKLRPFFHLPLKLEYVTQRRRQVPQTMQELRLTLRIESAANLRERHGEQHQGGQLGGEGLGRGDADFR